MKLSENEKREVVTYLEQGKPLPEKYRFLLFKDDREVELVWNGKTSERVRSSAKVEHFLICQANKYMVGPTNSYGETIN